MGVNVEALHEGNSWRGKYSTRLRLVDAGVVIWAVAGAFGVRFGFSDIGSEHRETLTIWCCQPFW